MTGSWALKGFSMFSVIEKESGRWVGRLGPWQPEGWPGTEVGWGLHRDAWGKGYATEGSAAAIQWAFDTLGWTDVIHCIDPDNVGSARVAERLGSTMRGPGKMAPPYDHMPVNIWGQTKAQWEGREKRQS
jgi:RimJ/RimL family protein N-acetyltransferase